MWTSIHLVHKPRENMKNRLLLFSALGAFTIAPAVAQIPNGGFENWTTVGNYEDPTGWITFNSVTSLASALPSCAKGSPGAVGSYYATVTTRNTAFGMMPGIISVGNSTDGSTGFPYTSRPSMMTGQWQYGIQASDSGFVAVVFTKWNTSTQTSDAIGGGAVAVTGTLNGWQAMNIPITFDQTGNPDSAFVIIASSTNTPLDGSFIKIDALALSGSAAIGEQTAAASLRLFPSPASDVLHVEAREAMAGVDVIDTDGRFMMQRGVDGKNVDLGVSDLSTGRYLLQVRWVDGTRSVRMFVKQ